MIDHESFRIGEHPGSADNRKHVIDDGEVRIGTCRCRDCLVRRGESAGPRRIGRDECMD
jgi:hypothetical protein